MNPSAYWALLSAERKRTNHWALQFPCRKDSLLIRIPCNNKITSLLWIYEGSLHWVRPPVLLGRYCVPWKAAGRSLSHHFPSENHWLKCGGLNRGSFACKAHDLDDNYRAAAHVSILFLWLNLWTERKEWRKLKEREKGRNRERQRQKERGGTVLKASCNHNCGNAEAQHLIYIQQLNWNGFFLLFWLFSLEILSSIYWTVAASIHSKPQCCKFFLSRWRNAGYLWTMVPFLGKQFDKNHFLHWTWSYWKCCWCSVCISFRSGKIPPIKWIFLNWLLKCICYTVLWNSYKINQQLNNKHLSGRTIILWQSKYAIQSNHIYK